MARVYLGFTKKLKNCHKQFSLLTTTVDWRSPLYEKRSQFSELSHSRLVVNGST